jgi:hypothetical protein
MSSRVLFAATLAGLSACQPAPVASVVATLRSQPPGLIDLGVLNRWSSPPGAELDVTLTVPQGAPTPTVDLLVGPEVLPLRMGAPAIPPIPPSFVPLPARDQVLPIRTGVLVPMMPIGGLELDVVLRADGVEVARWTVRRTVVDPEVTVCTAALPPEVEDEAALLDTCLALTPELVQGGSVLPFEMTGARVRRRLSVSVKQASVEATVRAFNRTPVVLERREVVPGSPQTMTFIPGEFEWFELGAVRLPVRKAAAPRSLVDRNPEAPEVAMRVGTSFELLRDVSMSTAPMQLEAFEDPTGALSVLNPLPFEVGTGPTSLQVRLSPKAVAPRQTVWAALRLRDGAGVLRTDRLPFVVTGLPAATCQLAIDDVSVGDVRVGDVKSFDLVVRNVGTAPCERVSTRLDPGTDELRVVSMPMPEPGRTALWQLRYSARTAGPQVRVVSVFFDDERPTAPDLSVRVSAAPRG